MTSYSSKALVLVALVAAIALPVSDAHAQSLGDRLKAAAKRKAEERAERRTEEATDAALDRAEAGAKKGAKGTKGAAAGGAAEGAGAGGEGASGGAAAPAGRVGEGAWLNYDFVPGDRVLFAEDFARDVVGDFPRRLDLDGGNMEVAEWQGRRWLRAAEDEARFTIPLPATLPERFTLEFDYAGWSPYGIRIRFDDEPMGTDHAYVVASAWGAGVDGGGLQVTNKPTDEVIAGVGTVRVMVDGRYVKVYVNDRRVANAPKVLLGRSRQIRFVVDVKDDAPTMLGNFRVAEGGRDLYDALAADGRVATHGILFDTGSDRLRGESTPTLKRIAAMLAAHPELRLRIEGHTDDVGDAAANRTLSEKRAAAVKAWLVAQPGIDATRLEAAGFGAAKPAAPNTTSEGRQQNRRVELVKL